jgi:hypothetical protein
MSIHHQVPALKPSAEARKLYNQMVAKAGTDTDNYGNKLYLSLHKTISLEIDRKKKGLDSKCDSLLYDLVSEGWVDVHEDGGWKLSCYIKR